MTAEVNYQTTGSNDDFAEKKRKLKGGIRRQDVRLLVKKAIHIQELQFKDDEAKKVWESFVESNFEKGFETVVAYASCWAKYMQYILEKHEGTTVARIASKTSQDAILGVVILDGYSYEGAKNILFKVWKYGTELEEWAKNMKKKE